MMNTKIKHINTILFVSLAVCYFTCCAQGASNKSPRTDLIEKPNVLFISMDDLNDWIEPLGGHPQAITPNFNRLAKNSVLFTHAYTANPACNPSRAAVLSGKAPQTTGVYSNYQDWREVIKDYRSLGGYFRDNGYYAAGAGKLYHYFMVDTTAWDDYWPSQKKNMPQDFPRDGFTPEDYKKRSENRTINMPMFKDMYVAFDWAPLAVKDSLMGDYKSVEWVSDQLRAEQKDPFFLACGIYRPHLPWYVPKKYYDMFPLESIQLPTVLEHDLDDLSDRAKDIAHRGGNYHKHVVKNKQWKKAVQGYLASIAFADAMLGRLLDALENSRYADNTVVVLWSDHGWQLGNKEHWRKFALWENTTKSVLMMHAPKGSPGLLEGSRDGEHSDRIVSLMDIYPTLLDLCGLPPSKKVDGRSLVPLLKNPEAQWNYPAITSYDFGEFSIRTQRWRYTRYIDGSEELYDHTKDEKEWHNLASFPKYQGVIRKMQKHIPKNPTPLKKTSLKMLPHFVPPFKSEEEYLDWLEHDKDNTYLLEKYWENHNNHNY